MAGTDEELIAALDRDGQALERLVERWWRPAWRLSFQITRDAQSAEDAAQDAFVRLLGAGGSWRPGRAFRPWFLSIAANCAKDRLKASARRRRHEEQAARRDLRATAPEGLDADGLARLERGLAGLPVEQRAALSLHYLEGLTFREVAQTLGCPEGTAASRVRRGLHALRRELEPVHLAGVAPLGAWLQSALALDAPPAPSVGRLREAAAAALAGAGAVPPAAAGLAGMALPAVVLTLLVAALLVGVGAQGPWSTPRGEEVATPTAPPPAPAPVASAAVGAPPASAPPAPVPASTSVPAADSAPEAGGAATEGELALQLSQDGAPCAGVEVLLRRLFPGDGTVHDPGRKGELVTLVTDAAGLARRPLGPGPWELRVGPVPGLELPGQACSPLLVAGQDEPVAGLLLFLPGEPEQFFGGHYEPRLAPVARTGGPLALAIPPLAVIAGRVVRAADGAPLGEATVKVGAHWDGRADVEGRFAVPVPRPVAGGRLYVSAHAPGFAPGGDELGPGEEGVISLVRGVDLEGRILTADGRPAAWYELELQNPNGLQWPLRADAEGRFTYRDLPPNRGPGHSLVYVAVRVPDAPYAYEVDLLARTGHEHVLRLPRYFGLTGVVRRDGRPLNRVELRVTGASQQHFASSGPRGAPAAEAPPSGEFELIGLEAGPAWLEVGYAGFELDAEEPEPGDPGSEAAPSRPVRVGAQAWRVEVPRAEPLELEVGQRVPTGVTAFHAGGAPARGARVQVRPQGAGDDPTAPVLEEGALDERGGCQLGRLGRGVRYEVRVELPDGRRAAGALEGGLPCSLVVPGEPLPAPARVRCRPVSPAGEPAPFVRARVWTAGAPPRLLSPGDRREGVGLSFDDPPHDPHGLSAEERDQGWLLCEVPVPGEVWVELLGLRERAVRRVLLAPGASVDLGEVALEPLVQVPVRVEFDPRTVTMMRFALEWDDPLSGLPLSASESNGVGPGQELQLALTPGRLALRALWSPTRHGPLRELPARTVDVDPLRDEPIVIRLP